MFSDVKQHVLYQILNAPLRTYPFPHIYVEEIFPTEFYDRLLAHLPGDNGYIRLVDTDRVGGGYSPQRLVLPPHKLAQAPIDPDRRQFLAKLFETFTGEELGARILGKFQQIIFQRFLLPGETSVPSLSIIDEACLMRDLVDYELGPHTDSTRKLVSVLFYLPANDTQPDLGTSLYIPKERRFACAGGPHHPFDLFERVTTLPYKRNTLLAFPKTPQCFHGVERVARADVRRDLLLLDFKGERQ